MCTSGLHVTYTIAYTVGSYISTVYLVDINYEFLENSQIVNLKVGNMSIEDVKSINSEI